MNLQDAIHILHTMVIDYEEDGDNWWLKTLSKSCDCKEELMKSSNDCRKKAKAICTVLSEIETLEENYVVVTPTYKSYYRNDYDAAKYVYDSLGLDVTPWKQLEKWLLIDMRWRDSVCKWHRDSILERAGDDSILIACNNSIEYEKLLNGYKKATLREMDRIEEEYKQLKK